MSAAPRRLPFAVCLAWLCACAPARDRPAPVVSTTGTATAAEDDDAPAPTAAPAPRAIAGPEREVCRLTGRAVRQPFALRLRPGAEVALTAIGEIDAALRLPEGPMLQGAFAELRGPGAVVRGWLNGRDVRVYPQKSLPFAGFAVPGKATALSWLEARRGPAGGRLKLALTPRPSLRGVAQVVDTVDCWDVGLSPGSFSPHTGLGKLLFYGELVGEAVPLSTTPGGEAVIQLAPPPGAPRGVSVHVDTGPHLRIEYRDDAVYYGWVPKTAVVQVSAPSSIGYGTGRSVATHHGPPPHLLDARRCDRDIPLYLGSADDALVIGHLDAGATFYLWRGGGDDLRRIDLGDATWLFPEEPHALSVHARDVAGCSAVAEN